MASSETRLGVPVLLQRELRTTVVVAFVDVDAEDGMRALHRSVAGFGPEPLAVDDRDADHLVYLFDVRLGRLEVSVGGAPYALVFQVMGLRRSGHAWLGPLSARGHAFVVVASKDVEAAVDDFRATLPLEAQPYVHGCAPDGYGDALKAVAKDVLAANQV